MSKKTAYACVHSAWNASGYARHHLNSPAAASYARGASQQAGFAAAKVSKRRAFELFVDGSGYEFLPLAGVSFGRLGKDAARFLNDLGEVAALNGCASNSDFVRTVRQ